MRRLLPLLGLIALVIGGIWLFRYETYGKYQQDTDDAYVAADIVTVSPKISGYVDRVFVADNQVVKAGQPLLQVDPRDYRAQSVQSQAQIDVAKANAAGVEAQISQQEAAIAQSRADLTAAEAGLAFARQQVTRYTPLAQSGADTREHLSDLTNDVQQATAKVVAARAGLVAAERKVGALRAQVAQARAQGEAAAAQLAAAQTNVQATILRAAIDGRIGDKAVRQGQFVQAGTRLMSVVPVAKLYVTANFKETQLGLMRVGQPVTVAVDALADVAIPGRIESFSPGTGAQFSLLPPQNATGNFTKVVQRVPVRIAISAGPETRKLLVPGLSVEVTVDTRSAKDAVERIRKEQEQHNARIAQ